MATGGGNGSGVPPQTAAANTLEAMLAKKQQLDDDLRAVEKAVYDSEEAYLEETNHYGNCVRGWDGFLTARPRPTGGTGTHHSSKRSGLGVKERVFSLSSTTAPIEGLRDDDGMDDDGPGGSSMGFRGEGGRDRSSRVRASKMDDDHDDD